MIKKLSKIAKKQTLVIVYNLKFKNTKEIDNFIQSIIIPNLKRKKKSLMQN